MDGEMNWTDVNGWFFNEDAEEYRRLAVSIPENSQIVELGVYQGSSLCSLAEVIKSRNLKVLAVDLFEDSPARLDLKDVRKKFDANILEFGLSDYVTVLKGSTNYNPEYSKYMVRNLSLVFIDADHTDEGIRQDVESWWPVLAEGAVMAGHDWPCGKAYLEERFKDRLMLGGYCTWSTRKGGS